VRILFLTPCVPDPAASHGGAVYLGNLLAALAKTSDVGVLCFRSPEQEDGIPVAGLRWQRTIERRENRHLRPAELRASQVRLLHRWGLRGLPLLAAKHRSTAMRRAFRNALRAFAPDAVMVEFATMAQYLPECRGHCTVFTDHEAGEPVSSFTKGRWADRREHRLWDAYLRAFYDHADHVQALTAEDAARLRGILARDVGTRPPFVRLPAHPVDPGSTRPVALFLGDYRHHPNPEAAQVIARDVWPQVRRRVPDAELWLAGRTVGDELAGLDGLPGVAVVGFVDDLPELLGRTRLLLAPVFSGGGSRIKVLTALAHGLPVVTNTLGSRGVTAAAPALQVVDDPGQLAERTVGLLSDARAAADAGRQARDWAAGHLAPDAVAAQQLELVRGLLDARR